MTKKILMIAGPNGSGKTTLTRELISKESSVLYEFINADEIAKGLAPLHPESVALTASKKTIVKRYYSGLRNLLSHYLPLADTANILDNSSDQSSMRMIAKKSNNTIEIINTVLWEKGIQI